ncbi:hypothetical protein Rs2_25876 [Raphanus sativus]|nr:hypothetical protein Rs2_25876 [Raphanus sativus]
MKIKAAHRAEVSSGVTLYKWKFKLYTFVSPRSSINKRNRGRSHQPYELEGKLPESADLEFKELNLCNVFHGKTCCSASSGMLSASLALQNLAAHGDASKDCLFWFELLECSICHPDVGVQSGPIRICASFCDSVFEACSDASFSSNTQVVVPCAPSNGTICEKASKLVTNGTAFCEAVGFTVLQGADDSVEEPCYGSKRVLVTAVESFKKTVRLQDLKNKLVMMNMQMCWSGSVGSSGGDGEGCKKIEKKEQD